MPLDGRILVLLKEVLETLLVLLPGADSHCVQWLWSGMKLMEGGGEVSCWLLIRMARLNLHFSEAVYPHLPVPKRQRGEAVVFLSQEEI